MAEELKVKYRDDLAKYPNFNTNWHMIRFIRARKMDHKKVCKMLENFFEFREKENIEEIKNTPFHVFEPLREAHERGLYGVDKTGRPILIERLGFSDAKVLLDKKYDSMRTHYFLQMMEAFFFIVLPVCSMHSKKRIGQLFVIYDMKKVDVKKMFDKDFQKLVKFLIGIIQDYYPEMLGKLFMINSNFMVMAAWRIVKPWLDKKTRNKIEIHSGVPLDKLAEFVDKENLPEFMGGSCNIPLRDNHGPWTPYLEYAKKHSTLVLKDRSIEYEYFYNDEEKKRVKYKPKKKQILDIPKEGNHESETRSISAFFGRLFRSKSRP